MLALLGATAIATFVSTANGLTLPSLPKKAIHPNYWFSFGDSYTTTGFNITTGPLPNTANPFGNPIFPGYTACGLVPNWIDDVTTVYNHSLIYTYNFAYGGATIDASLVTPYLPTVLSLTDQVNSFLETVGSHPKSTPWTSQDSMFSFFIGINDIGNSWYESGDRTAFAGVLLDHYFALVEEVYAKGARNFLFIDVPGVDKSPLMLAQPVASQQGEDAVIREFNKLLAQRVARFALTHFGVDAWFYDAHARLLNIIDHYKAYGFADVTSFGPNRTDLWCNNYHVGPVVHNAFAQDISNLLFFTEL